MDLPFFFIADSVSDDVLTLSEDISKHAVQVLRMKTFEKLMLTDGAGNLLTGEIVDAYKKGCTVRIVERKVVNKKDRQVCIAISLLKNASRFEWFLEKATEIGVTEIIPLVCERTERAGLKFERMKHILVSALTQSKQAWLPLLHEPVDVLKVSTTSQYDEKLVAHCNNADKRELGEFRRASSIQVLIGPEGDFTLQEVAAFEQEKFTPVTLGENRLRTETAGVVAAAVLCT